MTETRQTHVTDCRCEPCSRFRHPSGRGLTEHDRNVLARWAASWPHPPQTEDQ